MSTNNTPLPDTASGADLYVSRHDHPYDLADPCPELASANNRFLRGRCLIRTAFAERSALHQGNRAALADDQEHFSGCPCGRCQGIRAKANPLALVSNLHPCACGAQQIAA